MACCSICGRRAAASGLINNSRPMSCRRVGWGYGRGQRSRSALAPDLREYWIGAQILQDLGARELRLLTNNPERSDRLDGFGVEIVERVPIEIAPQERTTRFTCTPKKIKMGHLFQKTI